ncbi:MAG TPA: polymorphic toxin type 23 domain-containing protein [Bacteroidia bacterium]|nr:polymorphic toxin type 23 domain-containing protein [Bacteroidia bacterium]
MLPYPVWCLYNKGKMIIYQIKRQAVIITLSSLWFSASMCAQSELNAHWGIGVGVVAGLGTHFDRLGVCFKAYYLNEDARIQVNGDLRFYGNVKNLGPSGFSPEVQASLGLVFLYGKKDSLIRNLFLSPISNQSLFSNSVGYSQQVYLNPVGTGQRTGTVSFQFGKWSLTGENDIFAKPLLDRFRTGALLLQYTADHLHQYGLNCTLWTGEMHHHTEQRSEHFPNGYIDTLGSSFAGYSHGLLSLQVKTLLPFYDQPALTHPAQASIGIDAEQVRNAVQNKFFHDQLFLPSRWRSHTNCDMPMVDNQGQQFLYKPGQKIRAPRLYINGFLNPLLFY